MCQYVDMVCVHCGGKTKVVNSRHQVKANQVWRRRLCLKCGSVFTSEETPQYNLAWLVRKESRVEAFSADKLLLSLYKSCAHRPSALSDARGLTDTIVGKLAKQVNKGVISSRDIARVAQVALNRFDKAASTHYQAFHPS